MGTPTFAELKAWAHGYVALWNAGDREGWAANWRKVAPGEFSMLELAQMVIEMTGSRSKLVHLPLPADDPKQRRPDIGLAKRHLDWQPTVPLTQGLKHTVKYFDAVLSGRGN